MKKVVFLQFIILSLLLFSCSDTSTNPVTDSGKIKNEAFQKVADESISESGGTILVEDTDSPIDGFELEVPSGALSSSRNFKISYASINSHSLGQYFNPITPLIKIESGSEGLSKYYMTVRIPIDIPAGDFPLAFYYDRSTGTVEGITPIERTDKYLKILVRHFSEIGITSLTETQMELLKGGEAFSSWFEPSVHGWPFPNYGTYPTYQGNCAGMTMGAMWFYRKNPSTILNSGTNLKSMFDNDQLWFQTPGLWEDDVLGLKFVTMIQNKYFESAWQANQKVASDLSNSQDMHFWSLIYSMLLENAPEFLFVSDAKGGHAILSYAWKFQGNKCIISCYDPNYPSKTNNVEYNLSGSFVPYTSALNAGSVDKGDLFNFPNIYFIPLSSACSMDEIQTLWNQVSAKTIGEGLFPKFTPYIEYKDIETDETIKVDIEDVQTGKTNFLNVTINDALEFKFEGPEDAYIQVYHLKGSSPEKRNTTYFNLEEAKNIYGIAFWAKPAGSNSYSWCGFKWYKINMTTLSIKSNGPEGAPIGKAGELNKEYQLTAENSGETPKNAKYEWDFGDGNKKTVNNSNKVTYAWKDAGLFDIVVKMYDEDTKQLVGSATAKAGFGGFCNINIDGTTRVMSPFASILTSGILTMLSGGDQVARINIIFAFAGSSPGTYSLNAEATQIFDYSAGFMYTLQSGTVEITEYGPVLSFVNGSLSGTFNKYDINESKYVGVVNVSAQFSAIRTYDQ